MNTNTPSVTDHNEVDTANNGWSVNASGGVSLGLFALLGAFAAVWYVVVAGPAITDFPELRAALVEARRRVLGF